MRLIMMLNEHTAQTLREEGVERWLAQNTITPVLMVIKQDGNTVREVLDVPDEVYDSLWKVSAGPPNPQKGPCELSMNNGVCLLTSGLRAMVNGRCIDLNRKEYELLRFLMQHKGQVFTKEQLYRKIWNKPEEKNKTTTVTVHVNRLRKKIEENPMTPRFVLTVRGIGYCFNASDSWG